jgi:hypothetical protein
MAPKNDPLRRSDWIQWVGPMFRAEMRCEYCGLDGRDDLAGFRQLCYGLDHLIPKSIKRDGIDDPENLVVSCAACNRRKGAFDPRDENPDGTRDNNTPRERMITNVKEYLRGDMGYHEEAWSAFRAALSNI